MAFIFGKLAFILLRPSNFLLLLGLLGLAGVWRRPRPWAKAALVLSLGGMLLATLVPLGSWLMAPLENRFPRPAVYPERIDGAVVLGGAEYSDITVARGSPSLNDAAERLIAMLDLARRYPDAKILFTGGVGRLDGGAPPATETVALLLQQQGLAGRLILDDQARTTRENALHAKALVEPRPGETWLLVTSASHMPRAMGVFSAVGWNMTAWPVDYRTAGPFQLGWKALADRLYELDKAAKEWLGLAYYWLLGWTPALFPAP